MSGDAWLSAAGRRVLWARGAGRNDYHAPILLHERPQHPHTAWSAADVPYGTWEGTSLLLQAQGAALAWINDGLSNTLLMIERANVPHWDPPDSARDGADADGGAWAMLDAPGYSSWAGINRANYHSAFSYHTGGVNALVADGSVHWIAETTDEAIMAALFTREGGEPIDWSKVR